MFNNIEDHMNIEHEHDQDYSNYKTFCDDATPHLYKDGLYDKVLIMSERPVKKRIDD